MVLVHLLGVTNGNHGGLKPLLVLPPGKAGFLPLLSPQASELAAPPQHSSWTTGSIVLLVLRLNHQPQEELKQELAEV